MSDIRHRRLKPAAASDDPARSRSDRLPGFRADRVAGYTLLGLSVVILVLSVVAALAAPVLKQLRRNARSSAVIDDLRVFTRGLQAYVQARGDWPPGGGAPGDLPAGTETFVNQTTWERTTPIGGRYLWALNTLQQGERHRAVIVLSGAGKNLVAADRRQLEDIDRKLDDGDLGTGRFRLGYRNYPVFILEH